MCNKMKIIARVWMIFFPPLCEESKYIYIIYKLTFLDSWNSFQIVLVVGSEFAPRMVQWLLMTWLLRLFFAVKWVGPLHCLSLLFLTAVPCAQFGQST